MNNKNEKNSSSVTLNIILSILTVSLLFINAFKDGKLTFDDPQQLIQMGYVLLVAIVLATIINWKRVNAYFNQLKSQIAFFLNIMIEYRRGHLEFLDSYGQKAMYYEECHFVRVRRNEIYDSIIEADGRIDNEVHTYNCYNSLNHKKNKITITYGRKKENKDIIHNKRQLHFGFVVNLLDSFPNEKESWDTVFNHYTKVYDLKFSFSLDNPPCDVDIFQVGIDSAGNEKLTTLPVDPLIMQKYGRVIMKIKLLHLKKGDKLRVEWTWNKKAPEEGL